MKFLVDTQVFIWLINEDARLGVNTLETLQDTSNQIFISYFSFFEMTIKASIGKLNFDSSVMDDLPRMGIDLIAPSNSALQKYAIFNPDNKDPFDNILATVAITEKCTFITSDPKILTLSVRGLNLLDATK
ncbi:MAG TPA: type II toxin-antitoxin system VapC family toxin [Candidatus Saccharimonadales bacterium]|nr:type II toxin-antitoxin system VapC family toxin [Candidatus Saccharimonadales bacterium]